MLRGVPIEAGTRKLKAMEAKLHAREQVDADGIHKMFVLVQDLLTKQCDLIKATFSEVSGNVCFRPMLTIALRVLTSTPHADIATPRDQPPPHSYPGCQEKSLLGT